MIKLVEREQSGKRRGRLLVALRPIKILKKRVQACRASEVERSHSAKKKKKKKETD